MQFPALDPRALLRLGVLCLVGLLFAVGIRSCPASRADDPARDILAVDLARRMHANALALDSARGELAKTQARMERHVADYKPLRDTLNIHDTVQVKVFVQRADSVVRSCTDLAESCERFRVRADSSLAGLTLDRDYWKRATESLQPSRFDAFVRRTLPVVAFGVGLYVGAKAVR